MNSTKQKRQPVRHKLKFTNEDTTPTVPAPVLGQDNEKVYCGFLGLSQEQYSQLQASGIL